jgi:DMSO/TMAO reductase YedYZ molybdopterin-dependent catalytic subunit
MTDRNLEKPDVEARPQAATSSRGNGPVVVRVQPYNAEAPLSALSTLFTPTEEFYVRSNFALPEIEPESWRLRIAGLTGEASWLSLVELRVLPSRTAGVTLECAGNNRTSLAPLPQGEPWGAGAVSTGKWGGVSLREVMARVGLDSAALDGAVELLFEGADSGKVGERDESVTFARSLPLEKALRPDTLLAWELNGEPLTPDHGGPVRLVVPDWYGVASVKWLVGIKALSQPFDGYFQADRYIMDIPGRPEREPLRAVLVKSLITSPSPDAVLPPGRHTVRGVAWSGEGAITRVEVSIEGGGAWLPTHLNEQTEPHTWQQWEYAWEPTRLGRHVLRARATDAQGNTQPDVVVWNRLGYANNAIQPVIVEIRD